LFVTSSSSRSCWKLASAPRDCGELRRSKTDQEVEGRLVDAARTATARNLAAADDLATLNYTGGTTGKSKGALRYHREFSALANAILADFEFPETPSYLAVAPISHVAGTKVLPTLLRGGTVHMLKGFDPEALLKTIERERINFTLFVPTMIYVLLDQPVLDKTDLSSLERMLYGPSRQLRAHSTITDARSADAHRYARAPSTTPPMAVTYRRCRSRICTHMLPVVLASCLLPCLKPARRTCYERIRRHQLGWLLRCRSRCLGGPDRPPFRRRVDQPAAHPGVPVAAPAPAEGSVYAQPGPVPVDAQPGARPTRFLTGPGTADIGIGRVDPGGRP